MARSQGQDLSQCPHADADMLNRFWTVFFPLYILALGLLCFLAISSLAPNFRVVDKSLENELYQDSADAAANFIANLEAAIGLVGALAGTSGVEISNLPQTQTQVHLSVPQHVLRQLSVALDINKALIFFIVYDANGNPAEVISSGGLRKRGAEAFQLPWPISAIDANKVIADISEHDKTLRIAYALPGYSPGLSIGFLYAEIDFSQWLEWGQGNRGDVVITTLANRQIDVKLRKGKSSIDQPTFRNGGFLPKESHAVSLTKALPFPLVGFELVIKSNAIAPAVNAAAWTSIYSVMGMVIFSWSALFFLIHYFRKRYVLPLRRMGLELQRVVVDEASERVGHYGDSVTRLARLLDRLTLELGEARYGESKRLEETYEELYRTRARLEEIASNSNVVACSFCELTGKMLYSTSSLFELEKFIGVPDRLNRRLTWRGLYRAARRNHGGALKDCLRILKRTGKSRMQVVLSGVSDERIYELRLRVKRLAQVELGRIDIIALDNTERATAERELIRSEERKAAILNVAPFAYISIALDGTILEANPAAERLTGWGNIQLVGLNARRLIFNSVDYSRIEEIWLTKPSSPGGDANYSDVVECLTRSGSRVPVEVSGQVVAGVGGQVYACIYLQDLRQRIERDVALFRKGRELQEVFDLSPDGIVIFNDKDCLLQINNQLTKCLKDVGVNVKSGLTYVEFCGLMNENCGSKVDNIFHFHATEGGGANRSSRKSILSLKYTERILSDEISDGFSRVIYFTDITKEFQLDELKSGFLATAAHELRTPLAIILGFSELLTDEDYSDNERKSLSRSIFGNSLRLSALLNDLLDLAKIEAGGADSFKFEIVDATGLLTNFVSSATVLDSGILTYSGRRLNFEIIDLEGVRVRVDVQKVESVLHNLLSNAAKYSDAILDIDLRTYFERLGSENWVVVEIIDKGIGMTSKEIEHAFDRFWRSDSSTGAISGTGLGLTIAKEIMLNHDGLIILKSQPGLGATAVLKFRVFSFADSVGMNQDAAMLEFDQTKPI